MGVPVQVRHVVWVVALLCAPACRQAPVQPTPIDAPKITCPAPVSGQSVDGVMLAVTFAEATVIGGAPPLSTRCVPASAGSFPIGSTVVTCTVTDAQNRTDTCLFTVTVSAPPRITATRFVVFGDSMSDGELGFAPLTVGDPGPPVGYAFKLRTLLTERYTAQTFSVTDEGVGGESVSSGVQRLPGVLSRDSPEVLLLLDGVNDLNRARDAAIPAVVNGLRSMVRLARGRGVIVFVGTLLPQRPGGFRAFAPGSIAPANAQISAMAVAEGAVLVDLYQSFDGHTDSLLGPDGLHPNEAGYQKMADTFFTVLSGRLEAPASVLSRAPAAISYHRNSPR